MSQTRNSGWPMNVIGWIAWFAVVLLATTALTILGAVVGGLVGACSLLFLVLVAEGIWVWNRVSRQTAATHRG